LQPIADRDVTDLTMPGNGAVAAPAPLGISQQQRHRLALLGVAARQAVVL
jgi:hypothetical protein